MSIIVMPRGFVVTVENETWIARDRKTLEDKFGVDFQISLRCLPIRFFSDAGIDGRLIALSTLTEEEQAYITSPVNAAASVLFPLFI